MLDVFVADDDADYRYLVERVLDHESDLTLVGEAADREELIASVTALSPDLVLLDASMPGGVPAAALLRESSPETHIVLTSSLPARCIATKVAAASAVGSLAKDIPVARLPDALRAMGALVATAERAVRVAEARLWRDPVSPRRSRRLAHAVLEGWCDDKVLSHVDLLISELVTNGVQHAGSEVNVRIAVGMTMVRVEVGDRSPAVPTPRIAKPEDSGGRGLHIVNEVASRWGVDLRRTGKCVWFELPRAEAV